MVVVTDVRELVDDDIVNGLGWVLHQPPGKAKAVFPTARAKARARGRDLEARRREAHDAAPVIDAHREVFLRTRDERFALLVRRLGMGKAARLLLFAGAGKPVLVLGDKAVDELFFDAVGGADDGISVAVQLQGHRTPLGANQRIARHSPI